MSLSSSIYAPVPLEYCFAVGLTSLQNYVIDETRPREAIFRKLCEISASCLAVERVGVWLLTDAGSTLKCAALYERTSKRHSAGGTFNTLELPKYFEALSQRTGILAETAYDDPRTIEFSETYIKPLGITSMMDVPLIVAGEVIGVICHEHVGEPREWLAGERAYVEAMARLLSDDLSHRSAGPPSVDAIRVGERLAQTAGGVAHDFKNLLTIIQGNVELLGMNPKLSAVERRLIETIYVAVERGAKLSADLMLCARRRIGTSRVVSPTKIICDMRPILEATVGADYKLEIDSVTTTGRVFIDPLGLERVVMNLVQNARDASPSGSTITISTQDDVAPFEDDETRTYKLIEVRDYGSGMSSELLKTIFEPFRTTKSHGTGLGLAVVKEIVERAGGFVRVESQVEKGTCVRVYLPRISVGPKE